VQKILVNAGLLNSPACAADHRFVRHTIRVLAAAARSSVAYFATAARTVVVNVASFNVVEVATGRVGQATAGRYLAVEVRYPARHE
jgi:hypothetical protein